MTKVFDKHGYGMKRVIPTVRANGLWNHFTGMRKWTITCGECSHTWVEKVPIAEPSSAICPCCHSQNVWSAVEVDEKAEFEKRIKPFALDLSDKDFFFSKRESARKIVSGSGSVVFEYEGKTYRIDWAGYWDRSDWYEYTIVEVGNPDYKISGVNYLY